MKPILQLNWELCVEVLVTTLAAVFLVATAFVAEWIIVRLGDYFGSEVKWIAVLFKNALFLFDIFLFANMLWRILRRHRDGT